MIDASPELLGANFDKANRSISKQVLKAVDMAKERNEIVVILGSVFLMAEAREALGFEEPRDSDFISEMAGAGLRHGQENFGNTQSKA